MSEQRSHPYISTARLAGFTYLIIIVSGIFSLMYVPSQLLVWNDAATTTQNILAHEKLFRAGILASLICYSAFILLPLLLYKLFSPSNRILAISMVVLALLSVPISFINLVNKFAVLQLLAADSYLSVFSVEQLQAQAMFFLGLYDKGLVVVQVFWGLWLLPIGLLIFRSKLLPKTLGVLLILGCGSYLLSVLNSTLLQQALPAWIMLPATVGEVGTCLWLLIFGAQSTANNTLNNNNTEGLIHGK